jgi:hypothetical protein
MNPAELLKNEALRYLGFNKKSPHKVDPKTSNLLDEAAEEFQSLNSFRYAFKTFNISITADTLAISNSDITFKSASLSRFLANTGQAVFFTATLGAAVDLLIASLSHSSMEKALIYDAYASAYIEHKCDETQKSILNERLLDHAEMSRFSPGYGDLDLEYNDVIIDLVDAQKAIGLTVSQTHMLVPKKSIAAIFGFGEKSINVIHKCEKCGFAYNCSYKDKDSVLK